MISDVLSSVTHVKEYADSELHFSLVYGDGVYSWTGETVPDPFGGNAGDAASCPLLTNVLSGEQFFARRLHCATYELSRYRSQILKPPSDTDILWPCDLVLLHADEEGFSVPVNNQYTDAPVETDLGGGGRALLFPYGAYPQLTRADQADGARIDSTWKDAAARTLAIETVRAFHNLNLHGYSYFDVSLSRIFATERGSVFLDYSNLVYSMGTLADEGTARLYSPVPGGYPVEFMEPAYVQRSIDHVDFEMQNYMLSAYLFYVLFGNYAYDGRLLIGETDDSLIQHYDKFRQYHKMPVFIFDENDSRNALGLFAEDEAIISLWEESPEPIRELFALTLAEGNAMRHHDVCNPSPKTWLRTFGEIGWLDMQGGDVA